MTSDSFWKKEKFQLYRNKGKGYPTQRQLKRQLPSGAMCWKEHWPRSWQDRAWSSAPPLAPEWPWESPRASALFLFICKMERIKAFHIGFLWQNIQLKPINCPTGVSRWQNIPEYSYLLHMLFLTWVGVDIELLLWRSTVFFAGYKFLYSDSVEEELTMYNSILNIL